MTAGIYFEKTWERIAELNAKRDALDDQDKIITTSLRVQQDALIDAVAQLRDDNVELFQTLEELVISGDSDDKYGPDPARERAKAVLKKHEMLVPKRGESTIWRKSLPILEKALDSRVNGWAMVPDDMEKVRQLWLWVRSLIRS